MISNNEIVPVVMFHSIGLNDRRWVFSHISEPIDIFEEKIAALCRAGYHFLFWDDLYNHMAGIKKAPKKSIMLTFDDGYLDNWVFVFPILKKYGAKGTIFVNPEFVDPEPVLRPTSDDVNPGKLPHPPLLKAGFLSWAEMRAMESSGLFDIQSHSLTHTWYFSGPKLTDFHRPGDNRYPWLAWNACPERKPFYMVEDQSSLVPFGTPVYESEKALLCKKYFPPTGLIEEMTAFVSDHGGPTFFLSDKWEDKLSTYHSSLMAHHGENSRIETEDDYKGRVFRELRTSKRLIEKNLDKRIEYICWPGGGYNRTVLDLARKAGYKAWTLASRDQTNFRNHFGCGPEQVKRMGSLSQYQIPGGNPLGHAGGRYFLCGIERHKGSLFHTWLGRAILIAQKLLHSMRHK
jgi:peptidoglycan/xylan/chitin deacetylase (PgdA/CDA1 family)